MFSLLVFFHFLNKYLAQILLFHKANMNKRWIKSTIQHYSRNHTDLHMFSMLEQPKILFFVFLVFFFVLWIWTLDNKFIKTRRQCNATRTSIKWDILNEIVERRTEKQREKQRNMHNIKRTKLKTYSVFHSNFIDTFPYLCVVLMDVFQINLNVQYVSVLSFLVLVYYLFVEQR